MLTSAAASTAKSARDAHVISCPLGSSGKHIFLSYRRVDSHLAKMVQAALEKRGYVVFMDTSQSSGLGAGDVQAQLETVLRNTPVLVCLLTGTVNAAGNVEFRRIKNPGDLVRLEIRAALAMQKVVIPFFTADFKIGKMVHNGGLPEDVVDLGKHNFVKHDETYFDASIDKVHDFIEAEAVAGKVAALGRFAGEIPPEPQAVDDPYRQTQVVKCSAEMQAFVHADR